MALTSARGKKSASILGGFFNRELSLELKMAAAHSGPSEVEKSEEEEQDPVKEVIRWVVKTLTKEEEQALISDMLEYRDNLCRQLANHLSVLAARPADLSRFASSFKAGWQEWKKRDEQREESSFAVFLNAMNVGVGGPNLIDR